MHTYDFTIEMHWKLIKKCTVSGQELLQVLPIE